MTINPYESPRTDSRAEEPIDPSTRGSLAATIRAFLASEITAFEFAEALDAFRDSDDVVIEFVVQAVWFFYDDCDDHRVTLSKEDWDYFQRLLLLLASDCRVESATKRRWSYKQVVAAASLLGFMYLTVLAGWGSHLLIFAIPFGVVSIALSFWHSPPPEGNDPYKSIVFPFASFSDLATAYRLAGFHKLKYPQQIASRTIRSPLMAAFWHLQSIVLWLILSPVPLLFQMLPETQVHTRFVVNK